MTLLGLFLLVNIVGSVGLAIYGAGRAAGESVARTLGDSNE